MKLRLSERSTRLIRELETVAAECIDQSEVSRTTLAKELGVSRNTLGANLRSEREPGDTTDPRWAFAVLEFFGKDPVQVLEGLCPPCLPEELLSILAVPEPTVEPSRRSKAYRRRVACLRAAREKAHLVGPDSEGLLSRPWPERRQGHSGLRRVYDELEELEERRCREPDAVERQCARVITGEVTDTSNLADALRRIGMLGIWGIIQRRSSRLEFARDALSTSTAAARKQGDWTLLADQLRRSAWIFQDLGVPRLAVNALREASELCRADKNRDLAAYSVISRASIAAILGDMHLAQALFLSGLDSLTPNSSPEFRVMATQGVAICREHQGDLTGALEFLCSAVLGEQEHALGPRFRASLLLTSANLQRKLMRLNEAENNYREALALLEGERDPEAQLKVYVDLAICLEKAGKQRELWSAASQVQTILPQITNQSFLQTQAELLCRELASEIADVDALRKIRAALDSKSTRRFERRV